MLWFPARLSLRGYRDVFLGNKRQEREADHSPSSSSEVKTAPSFTPTSPTRLYVTGATWPLTLVPVVPRHLE
jgi:hypothetical protein